MKIKLGELANIMTGNTPSMKVNEYYDSNDIPFIKPDSFKSHFKLEANSFISNKAETKARIVGANCILVSCIGIIGKVGITSQKVAFNQQINSLKVKPHYDIEYIAYNLIFNKDRLQGICNSAVVPLINKSQFSNFEISINKDIIIQRDIKSKLNLLSSIIINNKKRLLLLDDIVKSRFVEMFGDPNATRTKYKLVPIHMVTDCMVPGRDKPKSFTGDIPWITINDLNINGYTNKSKLGLGLTIDEVKEVNRKCVPQGSVLMSCVGNLGLCSIASVDVVINQQLHSYQCNEFINNLYLMYYLSFKNTYMNKIASSTTVLYMNKNACNNIPVLLPPIELQISFAKYLNRINKLKSDVQKSIDETQLLMDSLMQEYFG